TTFSSGRRAAHRRTRSGCTTCARIGPSRSATIAWCSPCECARPRTKASGRVCGNLPSLRIRRTRNTRRGPRAGSRSSSQNRNRMPESNHRKGERMRIHNLYTDKNGESHFRDIEIEWAEERRGSKLSKRLPATGIIFRETVAEYDLDWHPAPRRQYIVNLDAGVRITASDGESRVIGAGEVILVEDTTGKGHLSKGLGEMRHSLFIPVE